MPNVRSESRTPRGELTQDGHVLVAEQREANRLYNKGYAGTPQTGGALRLSLVEAAQLVEEERLIIKDPEGGEGSLDFRGVLEHAIADDPTAMIPIFAYRDLRARGYVTRHANQRSLDFLVWARGTAPPGDKAAWLAGAISERAGVTAAYLEAWLAEAEAEDSELVLLLVDEEGDLTHYTVRDADPRGAAPSHPTHDPATGVFVRDRVIVWDEQTATRLHDAHHLGRRVPGGLQLSLVEATALSEQELLDCPGLDTLARDVEPDLELRTRVYRDLTARGLWVKTGFKFGTHFRVYAAHPEETHAPWLVHAVPATWKSTWPELSRAVRLAHGVRKKLLISIVHDDKVRHVQVERFRP